jgi:hypothetical protein
MNDPASPKSQRVGFADHPGISVLRILFPVLAKLAPTMAAKLALKIFLTPPRHKEPTWEAHFSALATRTTILAESQQIVVYSWGVAIKIFCYAMHGEAAEHSWLSSSNHWYLLATAWLPLMHLAMAALVASEPT